ncbi:low molecular weight protein arginine phosphatase [Halanaerobium sp. MA284_MarDTE_T2]|uniref:low molecular weight protein arginine phosphatase n=1 Tax=Halanaerobium sp. MA284_MarDTE_T2 TaxID=2183913 RepID=UPI000DF1F7D0|nr:low molecular weight protein arginine phosphatase [Halanaerobium sp. MA284_MarDTE_T2]RCW48269.1 protein-tyrosine phosphatase [Halanaerobium sp. MA284_MarDTE_T2]
MKIIKNILFVCTGNTCRSPIAEYIFREFIKDRGLEDKWNIQSAGVSAVNGSKINEKAKTVMDEISIDTSDHRSKNIKDIDLDRQNLILTMTRKHSRVLILNYPTCADNTFTLKEYTGSETEKDISDPFGRSVDFYRETRKEIEVELKKLLKMIDKFDNSEKEKKQ